MGWNSWNCAGIEITEEQVKEVADYMAEHLKEYGWEYVVIDAGWYHPADLKTENWSRSQPPQRMDEFGRLLPDTAKFPSSSRGNGFKPLADYMHTRGLKFGIHIMRGIPWNAYQNDLRVRGSETWYPHIAAHGWPDADMLPLGLLRMNGTDEWVAGLLDKDDPDSIRNEYSRLTTDEKFTMMNLWSIFRSPLMFGGYLPENDSLSLELITNEEMLHVNQHSTNNKQLYRDDDTVVWTADDQQSGDKFVAMFNISEEVKTIEVDFGDLGLIEDDYSVKDLWSSDESRYHKTISVSVPPHGSFMGRIKSSM